MFCAETRDVTLGQETDSKTETYAESLENRLEDPGRGWLVNADESI